MKEVGESITFEIGIAKKIRAFGEPSIDSTGCLPIKEAAFID